MTGPAPVPVTHDDLIAVSAWDGQLDDAWSMAQAHGASLPLWVELGEAREADHPLDAPLLSAFRISP